MRISLPGKEKHKKVILLILVLISFGVLIYEFIDNKKNKDAMIDNKVKKESEYLTGTSDKEEKSISKNDSDSISQKENDMYNISYNEFFSHNYSDSISKADELIEEFKNLIK